MDNVVVWNGTDIIAAIVFVAIFVILFFGWFIFSGLDMILSHLENRKKKKQYKEWDQKYGNMDVEECSESKWEEFTDG